MGKCFTRINNYKEQGFKVYTFSVSLDIGLIFSRKRSYQPTFLPHECMKVQFILYFIVINTCYCQTWIFAKKGGVRWHFPYYYWREKRILYYFIDQFYFFYMMYLIMLVAYFSVGLLVISWVERTVACFLFTIFMMFGQRYDF